MKLSERINYILLGTLWILFIVLVLDFWLNTAYNFNMFSNAHWQYVSNLQALHRPIKTGFYVAITLAIVAGISGLYVLFRPRFRKILLDIPQNPNNTQNIPVIQPIQQTIPTPQQNGMQRPPRLHVQMPQNITPPKNIQTMEAAPVAQTQPDYSEEIQKIFKDNGYMVLQPKTILKTPISLIALGTNETLWLGGCNISHEQMADVMLAIKSVFQETLGETEIDTNVFILNPSDQDQVEAILDVDSLDELSEIIAAHPNEPESDIDEEYGNMDAFSGYIETVISYLGSK